MNDEHPEPAEIAALDDGLLTSGEAASLRQHLDECSSCSRVRADLAMLRRELRDLPVPPLPDSVAQRIDAALAAEARRAEQPQAGQPRAEHRPEPPELPDVSRETAAPRPPARWPRMALAAAGAIVAVGLAGVLIEYADSPGNDSAQEESIASADSGGAAQDSLEAEVRALLAETGQGPSESPDLLTNESAASTSGGGPAETDSEGPTVNAPGDDAGSTSAAFTLPTCVREAIDRTEQPLAAKRHRYGGERAFLVVLPGAADPEQVIDAYVVDDCASASPPSAGKVLARETYHR